MPTNSSSLYTVANDLGYGSMKLSITNGEQHYYQVPSVIAIQRPQNFAKPIKFDHQLEQDQYFMNFMNHMDVTIKSPSVVTPGRFLIGRRAANADIPLRSFDLNSMIGKAHDDLSVILTLSTIAAQGVSDAYQRQVDLNRPLDLDIIMATAVPITEGKKKNLTETYAQKYLSSVHTVVFHNFATPITVNLHFKRVFVALEGEAAQMAIGNANPQLKASIKAQYDKQYPNEQNLYTADDLISAYNVAGIDIGAVTVDFPIISNGTAKGNASDSLPNGYDSTVLQSAIDVLQSQGQMFESITDLKRFLDQPVNGFSKRRQDQVRKVVQAQYEPFEEQIVQELSKTVRHAGPNLDVVYVYGGGSIPLGQTPQLRNKLINKIKEFTGGMDIPVIWIDPQYAQELNNIGLNLISHQLLHDYLVMLSTLNAQQNPQGGAN